MPVISPIAAIGVSSLPVVLPQAQISQPAMGSGFGDLVTNGLNAVDARVSKADALIEAFAKGDAIPVHQITMALEQARISVELAVQVRTRLLETYRDLMNMQL